MSKPVQRVVVLCRYGCGTSVATNPSHKHDACCKTCKKKHHTERTNEARRIRLGIKPKESKPEVMSEEAQQSAFFWGN